MEATMPLTAKGEKILGHMEETYGSEKKAKQVLYASKNAGKVKGIDMTSPPQAGEVDQVPEGYSVQSTSTPPSAPPMMPSNAMPAPPVPGTPPTGQRSTAVGSLDTLARAAGKR
jgi:hypothetical protein